MDRIERIANVMAKLVEVRRELRELADAERNTEIERLFNDAASEVDSAVVIVEDIEEGV